MMFRTLLLSLLLLVSVSNAHAASLRILVDGSGSMRGYHITGELETLVAEIQQAAQRAGWQPAIRVFVTGSDEPGQVSLHRWDSWSSEPVWGVETHLDLALEKGGEGAIALVLLTDNFQDENNVGGGKSGATERFYDLLRSQPLSRAWLAPIILDFQGAVEIAAGSGLGRDKNTAKLRERILESTPAWAMQSGQVGVPSVTSSGLLRVHFEGRRGLAAYFLLYDEGHLDAMVKLTQDLPERREMPRPLLIRPMGADSITIETATDLQPDRAALGCLKDPAQPLPQPNMRLVKMDGIDTLARGEGFSYDPRHSGNFVAAFEVAPTESHVRVGAVEGGCEDAATVSVGPVVATVPPDLDGILIPGRSRGEVVPPYIVGRLDGGTGGSRALVLSIELPPLVGLDVPPEIFDGKVRSDFDVTISLPRRSLGLDASVASRYFTSDPLDLARIYSPTDVVQHLASDEVSITLPVSVDADVMTRSFVEPDTPPWLAIFSAIAAMVGLWIYLRPLGFEASVLALIDGAPARHTLQLAGLLRPIGPHEAHVGQGRCVSLRRRAWWSRCILVSEEGHQLALLTRGREVRIGEDHILRWPGLFQDQTP